MPPDQEERSNYEAVQRDGGFIPLQRAHFRLTGSDRERYLNGQISNAVRKGSLDHAAYACVMNAKGRMCGDIHYSMDADAILIDCHPNLCDPMRNRLERYIIADDAVLEDATDSTALVHFFGTPEPPASLPGSPRLRTANRFGKEGRDILTCPEDLEAIIDALTACSTRIQPRVLDAIRIENGIPAWGFELDDQTIPIEAGLAERAIDYEKGCYIGQEVVSRLKTAGTTAKSLVRLIQEGNHGDWTPEGRLFPAAEPENPCGRITSTAHSFRLDKTVALGYVKRGFGENGARLLAENHPADMSALTVQTIF